MDMGESQYYPYEYDQYSWTQFNGYPVQTTAPFGQGVYPDQSENYYNAGYHLQQEGAAMHPSVPIMSQQMASMQTGYFMSPDGAMYYQSENGDVVNHHGLFTGDYCTDPRTAMDYYQYPTVPQPSIYNYGCYDQFNDMYNFQQSYYATEDYSGGPTRSFRHQYHDNNIQPYSVPQQPASTRCNTSTAKNTAKASQETETLAAMSELLAEAEDLKAAIQRGEIQIGNQSTVIADEKCPEVNNQSPNQHSCNAPVQLTTTSSNTVANTSAEVKDDKPPKEFQTVTVEDLLSADPVEADALLDDLERRIEAICASEQQDHESSFRSKVKKALESEEFSDLWEIMEEGTAASEPKMQVCQQVPKVPKAKERSNIGVPKVQKTCLPVQSEQSKVIEVITINDTEETNDQSQNQMNPNGVTVSEPLKKRSLDLSYLDFMPLERTTPHIQTPGVTSKSLHKKPGFKQTKSDHFHNVNKDHQSGTPTPSCHDSKTQSHLQLSDRDEVFRAEGLDSVFVELRAPGNDVIVDPQTLDTPKMHKNGRKRCNEDKNNHSAKRLKVSAGTWLACSSSSTDDDVIFMGVRRCNANKNRVTSRGKWRPGLK